MTAAIILAGGSSERLSTLGKPKQFLDVAGKPLIEYTLTAFEQCVDIDKIIVIVSAFWRQYIVTGDKFFAFADPGKSRQESILNGLLTIDTAEKVIIHDAVRPLITADDISECLSAMDGYDGAMPYLKLTDTVYQSKNGVTIGGLLKRDELYAGQTPECYDFKKYLAAHEGFDLSEIRGSSELAFLMGLRIRLYPGNKRNFKITMKPDLDYLTYLLERSL